MHPLDEFRDFVTESEPLAPLTWLRIGGPAQFLARPPGRGELARLMIRCRELGLPVRVLGDGSNLLIPTAGVDGVVVHLDSPAFSDVTIDGRMVEAGTAVPLTALISRTARAGLAGLEILTGIPGSVGGAVRGNAGSRGGAIGQFVRGATVLDASGVEQERDRDDLDFGFRSSNLEDPILLAARFSLDPEDPEAVVRRMRRIWIVKKENQPYGHQSSGLIFRDPTPEASARVLIEQAGMKGAKVGGAEVSDRHANFIVAQPGTTSGEVLELIDTIRRQVRLQLGYELEPQLRVW